MTRSPTRKSPTPPPTATTTPAASEPGMKGGLGLNWYLPASMSTSTYCTPRAPIRTWISPAPGAGGSATSRNASTSGPPNDSHTIAFISSPLGWRVGMRIACHSAYPSFRRRRIRRALFDESGNRFAPGDRFHAIGAVAEHDESVAALREIAVDRHPIRSVGRERLAVHADTTTHDMRAERRGGVPV